MLSEMDQDANKWLARWKEIAGRGGLMLNPDGEGWRLDPLPVAGMTTEDPMTLSEDVSRRPDGKVDARRMTREEVEAFFGPDDGPI